jgi:hypothetical protein
LYRAASHCPFGIADSGEQRIQIHLGAVPRVFTMGHVNSPTRNLAVHAQKMAAPRLLGWSVIDKDLRADYVNEAMFNNRIGRN